MTPLDPTPAALDIEWAYHNPALDRFPWQIALSDARLVLLSGDLTQSAMMPARGVNRPLRSLLPPTTLPPLVLAAVRAAVERADRDELAELFRRCSLGPPHLKPDGD